MIGIERSGPNKVCYIICLGISILKKDIVVIFFAHDDRGVHHEFGERLAAHIRNQQQEREDAFYRAQILCGHDWLRNSLLNQSDNLAAGTPAFPVKGQAARTRSDTVQPLLQEMAAHC